jgi:hypothetical protein
MMLDVAGEALVHLIFVRVVVAEEATHRTPMVTRARMVTTPAAASLIFVAVDTGSIFQR